MIQKLKSIAIAILIILVGSSYTSDTEVETKIPAYYRVAVYKSTMDKVVSKVKTALGSKNFSVIGNYSPGNNPNWKVIVYTRKDLKNTVIKVKDRGALAAALKVGIYKKGDLIYVTMNNPEYQFNAYLRAEYSTYKTTLSKIKNDAVTAMSSIGKKLVPFGGEQSTKQLKDYHYMVGMPYFTDPVELKTFGSYETAVNTIRKNLTAKKGNTKKVYEISYPGSKVTVFGIGLLDKSEGESHFLPIIGETHLAAMPYELIVQGNKVTMLHGRYRIALHWPDLTMGTFTKIMSTPGDVESAFLKLME